MINLTCHRYDDSIYASFGNAYNESLGVGANTAKSPSVAFNGSTNSYSMLMVDKAVYGFVSTNKIDSGSVSYSLYYCYVVLTHISILLLR